MRNILKKINPVTFTDPVLNSGETEFEVNNWIISDFVISKLVPVVGVHPFPLNELMLMSSAVCRFKPTLIFEWGTNIGKSARVFYETIKAFKINCEIHTIDLPDHVFHNEHPHQSRGQLVRGLRNITLHQADGVTRSFEVFEKQKEKGNVLFFIDGDHSYETVKRELSSILERIPSAIILLHDTFYQSAGSGYNIGPFKAVEDVLEGKRAAYKVIATNTGLPGMALVFKK